MYVHTLSELVMAYRKYPIQAERVN